MARSETPLFEPANSSAEKRALDEAESDIAAGRVISHDAIRKWLRSWGKPDELPPPKGGE